jgi:hypothetical protein
LIGKLLALPHSVASTPSGADLLWRASRISDLIKQQELLLIRKLLALPHSVASRPMGADLLWRASRISDQKYFHEFFHKSEPSGPIGGIFKRLIGI